jgi:alkylation response protein AidB-like acyl-CoA dehydrogenase
MDLRPDPLQAQLRRALRAGLDGATARPGVSGAPVDDGPASPAAQVLAELGAALFELPSDAGGMELGLMAGVTVSEELGRAACGNPYRARALAADAALASGRADVLDRLLAGVTVGAAGLDALPTGGGVTIRPSGGGVPARATGGGWELTGTVIADAADADLLAVACCPEGEPALALVPGGAPGRKAVGGWPFLIELTDVTVTPGDLLSALASTALADPTPVPAAAPVGTGLTTTQASQGLTATPLARARVRQAAYLHGLATGMLEAAVGYSGKRSQFGTRLREFQAVSFPLARAVVALRAARLGLYHAAWLLESPQAGPVPGDPPAEALAASAEALTGVARVAMQACGVRAMTPELPLHRYYRIAVAEATRYGHPAALWRLAGAARLAGYAGCMRPER